MSDSSLQPNVSREASAAQADDLAAGGIVRSRSVFQAARSSLSPSARPEEAPARGAKCKPLLERLPTAAQALRYEAVLDAFSHMGEAVIVREFDDYAAAGQPVIFACVRPLESGDLDVGLALPPSEDEALTACHGEFPSPTIQSKFLLRQNRPISGQQMRWIRLASRAVQ